MIVRINTLEDERLDAYARLTEAQLRNKLEPEKGIFIAESGKVIERALEGEMQPLSLLMEEKWLPSMASIVERIEQIDPAIPVFVAPHDELEKLCGFELTRGALGAFRRPRPKSVAEACEGARVVAVLEDITNHTNVGAIFRSAAALALSDDSVSLRDEKLKECEKIALVLGTEGDGLAESTIARCDYTVKIPMYHQVDSLNVAAASAVAFWELVVPSA